MDTHIEFFMTVNKFFYPKLHPKANEQNGKNEDNGCLTLPYVANASLVFKKALFTLFKKVHYHCNVDFRTYEVSNYFSLNDVTPLTLGANVVYCFKGSRDKTQSYIGKTKRHLVTRVQEHLSGKSAIGKHTSSCKDCHSCSISNFYPLTQSTLIL